MRRGIDRSPRRDIDIDFDSFESITDIQEALGGGVIEFHGPEFEEPSFGEFLWEEVVLGGLLRAEAEIEITISACEICVGIGLDISLYETAQGKGPRVCYRFAECKEEEEFPQPPPPPKEPPPPPRDRMPPPRRVGRGSKLCGGILTLKATRYSTSYTDFGANAYTGSVELRDYVVGVSEDDEIFLGSRIEAFEFAYRAVYFYTLIRHPAPIDNEQALKQWDYNQANESPNNTNQYMIAIVGSEQYGRQRNGEFFPQFKAWDVHEYILDCAVKKKAPPPGEHGEDEMNCCKNQRDNDALLKKIYRELVNAREDIDEMGEAVGIEDFPAVVPNYLTENLGSREIKSIPQFQRYLVEQLDALVGEFPIEIEIEDTDPTQSGNQTEYIKLPNLAESIAEIYGLLTKTAIDGDVALNFLIRLAFELESVKAATLLAQSYARGNAAYLGYQGNLEQFQVQNFFNIDSDGIENLDDLLQEKKATISSWINEDKNTVQGYLERIMFAASIIKEVYVKNDGNRTAGKMINLVGDALRNNTESKAWKDFIELLNTEGFVGRTSSSPQPSAQNIDLNENQTTNEQ